MGKQQSKEEIVIAQNAAGAASNNVGELTAMLNTTNTVSTLILLILCIGLGIILYKFYKKCHSSWIRDEMRMEQLRRIQMRFSGRRREQQTADIEDV